MRTIALLTIAIAAALSISAPAKAASDQKYIGPGDCQPYGQSSNYETLPIRADGIQNKTTNTNKYVICPINRDLESSWTSGTDGLDVTVYVNYIGNGTIPCTLTEGQDFDGLVPEGAQTVNAVPVVGSIRAATFTDVGVGGFSATVTCRLPPQAKFLSIQMEENGTTDAP